MAHRYLFPIGIIAGLILAALTVGSHLYLERAISMQHDDSSAMNITGRQRMLSQRTALLSVCLVKEPDADKRKQLTAELNRTIGLMESSHQGIMAGDTAMGIPPEFSPEMKALYLSEPVKLDKKISDYVAGARELASTPEPHKNIDEEELHRLVLGRSGGLLSDLDTIVKQHQEENELDIERIEKVNDWLMALSLVVLGLMAAFIFTPMVRRIKRETGLLEESKEELETRVTERTSELIEANKELKDEIAERQRIEDDLRESEEQYKTLFEQANDSIVLVDPTNGNIEDFNDMACASLGYTRDEFRALGINDIEIAHRPDHDAYHIKKAIENKYETFDTEHLTKNGDILYRHVSYRTITIGGRLLIQSMWHDITKRKEAEEKLKESEEQYRTLFEQANDSIVFVDADTGDIIDFNEMASSSLGYTKEEYKALGLPDIEANESPEEILIHTKKVINEGSDIFETKHKTKDGELRDILVSARTITIRGKLYIQALFADITESKEHERELKKAHDELEIRVKERTGELSRALDEKEVLLKEIHHRVKNNMQVISSMLALQSGYITDKRAIDAFQESCERIRSMALVHEKLYQSPDLASIDFAEYINDLTTSLARSYDIVAANVKLSTKINYASIDIDAALQFGLIINELVSNALKHAFPNNREGEIRVELSCDNKDACTLAVSDNGVGLPEGFDIESSDTLGLELVKVLAGQTGGSIDIGSTPGKGTTYKIYFPIACEKKGQKNDDRE